MTTCIAGGGASSADALAATASAEPTSMNVENSDGDGRVKRRILVGSSASCVGSSVGRRILYVDCSESLFQALTNTGCPGLRRRACQRCVSAVVASV